MTGRRPRRPVDRPDLDQLAEQPERADAAAAELTDLVDWARPPTRCWPATSATCRCPGQPRLGAVVCARRLRHGVLAVHSLSKRSNLAGYRAGFVAGDPDLVAELLAVRKHAGMIMPAPVQAAMIAALADEAHVDEQRARYGARRECCAALSSRPGSHRLLRGGSLPVGDPWRGVLGDRGLVRQRGILVAPGTFYGPAGARHVRVALTGTDAAVATLADRLGCLRPRLRPPMVPDHHLRVTFELATGLADRVPRGPFQRFAPASPFPEERSCPFGR